MTLVDTRGKKKKSGSGATCTMDCSATCCLDTTCATDLSDCAGYINREFMELYTGVITILSLVIGIPAIIYLFNFCLMYRFCQQEDEESDTKVGGFTICEIIPKFICCCFFKQKVQKNIGDDDDDIEIEAGTAENQPQSKVLKVEQTVKTKHIENNQKGGVKNGKLSPSGSNEDIKPTNRSSLDEADYSKSKKSGLNQLKSKSKSPEPRKYKNKCVRFICIVFCCADSNINGEEEKNQEDAHQLLNSGDEEVDFDKTNGPNLKINLGIGNTAKNSKNSSQILQKIDIQVDEVQAPNDEDDEKDSDDIQYKEKTKQ